MDKTRVNERAKQYPGHAKRVMMGVWSFLRQFMYTKFIIVCDDDINARDWKDVIWADMMDSWWTLVLAASLQRLHCLLPTVDIHEQGTNIEGRNNTLEGGEKVTRWEQRKITKRNIRV